MARILIRSVCIMFIVGLAACSKNSSEPYVGEKVDTATSDGVTLTQRETRSRLESGGLAGTESALVQVEATVEKVDLKNRKITLTSPSGDSGTYSVSKEIRNLEQVKPGDKAKVEYFQMATFETREPTADEVKMSGNSIIGAARAKKGALPAGMILSHGVAIVTVQSIDKDKGTVTVVNDKGDATTIKAKYPQNLKLISNGQKIVVTYSESVVAGIGRI